jgi:anti-anti-sigma factor
VRDDRTPFHSGNGAGDLAETFHNLEVELMDAPRSGVALSGDLDLADAEAVHHLLARLARDAAPRPVLVDLRGLEFLDSHGVRALFRARDDAERVGSRLTLCASDGPVRRTLELVDADGAFEMVDAPPDDPG